MAHRQLNSEVFAGGSAVAKQMRSHPWHQTDLGKATTWSANLKTLINILLNANSPMLCVWGQERTVFYNDACLDLFQTSEFPIAVGQSLRGYASDQFNGLLDAIEQVFATQQSLQKTGFETSASDSGRVGQQVTWSYSPVWDDAGQVVGVFASGCHGNTHQPYVKDFHDRKQHDHEQVKAQRAHLSAELAAERSRFETVLRQIPAGVLIADAASDSLILANEQTSRIFRCEYELGAPLPSYRPLEPFIAYRPDGTPYSTDDYPLARSLRTGEVVAHEEMALHFPDGQQVIIDVNATPIFNPQGQITSAIAIFQDVTSHKQAEAALRQSEERFRNLADHISQFAWMTDPSGWIFWYNQRWFDYTGTTLEQMKGWGWQQVHHPDHVDRVVAKISRCFETGEPWEDTFPLRGKDGQYRWFLSRALPIRDETGKILRWFGTNTDITEHKQAEEALAQREAELRLVTNAVPALIAFVDSEQRYRYNNDRYQDWLNLSTTDLYGKSLQEVFDDASYEEVRPYVERVLTGKTVHFERQLAFQNGVVRDVSVTYVPQFTAPGTVAGFVALVNDIGDRKQAEAALRQSEDRFRMAIESAHLGTWDWNLITNELNWDAGCKRMFGLSADAETSIETFFAGLHPDDHDRLVQVVQECLDPANGGGYDTEYRTLGIDDGVERWILAKGQVYFDADQTPQRFIGTVLDITNQKQYEQALMTSEMIARTRAEELTAIMETTPAAIWIAHDPQCHEMTANKTAYELMDMQPDSIVTATAADGSNPLPFRQCRKGQDIEPHNLPMQQAISTRQEVTDEIEFVFADGTVRTIYGKAVPLFGPQNRVRGAIGGFVDITALKQSEQERERLLQRERQARAEAENASRIKDEFLAILSHELRSPLNPILGWVSLLRQGQLDTAKTTVALETIERNAKLQIQLIDDLLDVSRIIRGKLRLSMAPIDLASTAEAAIETVRLAAEAKDITIQTQFGDQEGQVLGDSARLQQVLWNLLSNAVKFTPDGGQVTITLSTVDAHGQMGTHAVSESNPESNPESRPESKSESTLLQTAQYAQIQVSDTGKGIPPAFLPHVFEYFRQADSTTTRAFGGLGLGLAIVRYLVELHGGSVWADSPGEGQGATFTVRLPLRKRQSSAATSDLYPIHLASDPSPLQGRQILVLDDDPDTRQLLVFTLEQKGADVVATASARAALEAMNRLSFDLMISDIAMPDMDGYMLMRHIREGLPSHSQDIPAIALTAYAGKADRERALAAGFHQHIPKPVDLNKLLESIFDLLQTSG